LFTSGRNGWHETKVRTVVILIELHLCVFLKSIPSRSLFLIVFFYVGIFNSTLLAQLCTGSLGDPVVILDDVFSVLDPGRRARMLEFVVGFEQVLITAADLGLSPELELSATYSVMGGELIGD